jgi:flagellar secretion chaperone FliS
MSTNAAYTPNAYRANAILTASHGQQIVMLYDGARRFLFQAGAAMSEGESLAAHNKLTRAEDIIRHLRSTLDMEQGDLPDRLNAIYTFSLSHLRQGRVEQDPAKLEQVSDLLGRLRDAWATVAGDE